MAIVLNNQEEEKMQQGVQGPVTIGGGQAPSVGQEAGMQSPTQGQSPPKVGAVGGSPQAPKTPGQQQAGSSGRFQNLSKFIKANQPGQFGQQFQQKVGQVAQQGQQAIGQAKQQFQQEAGKAGQQLQQVGQAVGQAQQSLSGRADEQAFNQAAEQLGQGLSAQYQGPQALANQARLQSQAQQASDVARAAGSGEGRAALLQKFFSKPSYSAGQGRLDNLLLSSQSGALRNVRQQGRQVGSQLDQAAQEAAVQAGTLGKTAADIQAQAKQVGTEASSGIESTLAQEAQQFAREAGELYDPMQQSTALNTRDIDVAGMRLNEAQKAELVRQGMIGVSGGSLTKAQIDEMARTGDYSSILGKTSELAQSQAGRFNRLSEMLNAGKTLGGDLLSKGNIGLSDEARANLESQIAAQGIQGAEQGYAKETLEALGRQEVDRAFRGEGGTAEQQARKEMTPTFPLNINGKTVQFGSLPKFEQERIIAERADKIRQIGGKSNWAGEEARRIGDAKIANIRDRSTKEGQEYYQQQLKAANRAALNKILSGVK